ncbi:hypothetical protein [Aquabacter spiritensis]|uniref:hypothetical protein n=1 Tax=Aquabacter spiritensis TaxID=933073 RepID=UPI001404DAAF|nr:hypothetical protein [Aquabacter spiritensis]
MIALQTLAVRRGELEPPPAILRTASHPMSDHRSTLFDLAGTVSRQPRPTSIWSKGKFERLIDSVPTCRLRTAENARIGAG